MLNITTHGCGVEKITKSAAERFHTIYKNHKAPPPKNTAAPVRDLGNALNVDCIAELLISRESPSMAKKSPGKSVASRSDIAVLKIEREQPRKLLPERQDRGTRTSFLHKLTQGTKRRGYIESEFP